MSFSDFSQYGYQIERELGQNSAGGRITYLATEIKTQQQVVIKQFQFARSQSNWTDYEAYQREIQILQQLNHPSIPCYLESFETETGFCLVQEYKNAPSLAQSRHWTPAEVKQIAVAILEVLIYLQKQTPPIIHRDIKPENILVDRKGKLTIYLVDFGFASFGDKEVAVSSVVKGTLGFMPPEQIFNRQLTTASDLYSLGMTLICLLTKTKSVDIGNLIDDSYQVNFKPLLPKLNPQFITWLERITAPSLKQRYSNATTALAGLLTSKVNLNLPVATKVLICITPIIFIVTTVSIGSIEFVKFSSQVLKAVTVKYTKDPVKQLLTTRHCPRCNLSGANLEDARLAADSQSNGTKLWGANLTNANLVNAQLANADLTGANLENAKLWRARLYNVDLRNANLKNADLRDTYLYTPALDGAILDGANLTGAEIYSLNQPGISLKGTLMPDGKIHP